MELLVGVERADANRQAGQEIGELDGGSVRSYLQSPAVPSLKSIVLKV